jgi:hypothetical protein
MNNLYTLSLTHKITQEDRTILFDQIQKLPENSLIERMLSWCEENDEDPMELGEIFSQDDNFKKILWADAVRMNQVSDNDLKTKMNQTQPQEIW